MGCRKARVVRGTCSYLEVRRGCLDSGGSSGDDDKESDPVYILKVELTGFADGLDIGCEKRENLESPEDWCRVGSLCGSQT